MDILADVLEADVVPASPVSQTDAQPIDRERDRATSSAPPGDRSCSPGAARDRPRLEVRQLGRADRRARGAHADGHRRPPAGPSTAPRNGRILGIAERQPARRRRRTSSSRSGRGSRRPTAAAGSPASRSASRRPGSSTSTSTRTSRAETTLLPSRRRQTPDWPSRRSPLAYGDSTT